MARGAKQITDGEIVAKARELFSEKGYDKVAMRDIASALHIGVGNLTYYFKKKEDLIEAVVLDLFHHYEPKEPLSDLEGLRDYLLFSDEIVENRLFQYGDFAQSPRVRETVLNIRRRIHEDSVQFWRTTLENLVKAGLLREQEYPAQFEYIAGILYFLKHHWNDRRLAEAEMGIATPLLSDSVWSILFPLLSKDGKSQYRGLREGEKS